MNARPDPLFLARLERRLARVLGGHLPLVDRVLARSRQAEALGDIRPRSS